MIRLFSKKRYSRVLFIKIPIKFRIFSDFFAFFETVFLLGKKAKHPTTREIMPERAEAPTTLEDP